MEKPRSKSDPVYKAAKKYVRKLLKTLAADTAPPSSELSDEQIHELRVCTKKLRALVQLYRPCCSKTAIKLVDQAIKTLADSYADQRDAHVQYETLNRVLIEFKQQHDNDMQVLLDHYQQMQQNQPVQRVPMDAQSGLEPILQIWKDTLKPACAPDFAAGVDYAYRKSRKLAYDAESSDSDEVYHQCRKWVKYYFYQLQMLVKEKRGKDKTYLKKLSRLGDLLGEFHDRCVLEQTLNSLLQSTADDSSLESAILLMLSWLAQQKRQDKIQCQEWFESIFVRTHNPIKL
jgi:CHAD domain-containing protein